LRYGSAAGRIVSDPACAVRLPVKFSLPMNFRRNSPRLLGEKIFVFKDTFI